MKYYELEFEITNIGELLPIAKEVLADAIGNAGFESSVDTAQGLLGYIQTTLFDEQQLQEVISDFVFPDAHILYKVREAPDVDYNEQWEQDGFQPIVIDRQLAIHDGRHLPADDIPVKIEINAQLAFGTGNHETTRMMVAALLNNDLNGKRVLDCGTGTGILSIAALKLGAASATGYDIDDWSVRNAQNNAIANAVDQHFTALLGDATVITSELEQQFDLVVANINRNILLSDLPTFRRAMAPHAVLLLSGFYTADAPTLVRAAATEGLTLVRQREENGWCCLELRLP